MTEDIDPKSARSLPSASHGLFLVTLEIMEQVYSVPVSQREALLIKLMKEKKAEYLGHTDKTGPEIAIELIKKGVKAKALGFKAKKAVDKNL